MTHTSRKWSAALVALGLFAAACQHAPEVASPTFERVPCPDDVLQAVASGGTATCGYVIVPERHANADGRTVDVFVARFVPEAAMSDVATVVLGGLDVGATVRYGDDVGTLLGRIRREVVVIEPRGTGHGRPSLACPEVDDVDERYAGASLADPDVHDAFLGAVSACASRLRSSGIALSAYTMDEAAADVTDVIEALGLERFDLGTYGYDSKIAFEVLRAAPTRLRAAWMDSPLYPGQSVFDTAVDGTLAAISNLSRACASDGSCERENGPVESTVDEVITDARAAPTMVRVTAAGVGNVAATLDGTTLARGLRDLVSLAPASVPSVLAELARGTARDLAPYLATERATCFGYRMLCSRSDRPSSVGAALSMLCTADAASGGTSPSVISSHSSALTEALADNAWADACSVWPVAADDSLTAPVRTDVPLLLLHGAFDAYSTVPEPSWLSGLSRAYSYTLPSQGFNVIGRGDSACAVELRNAFIADPTVEPSTDCVGSQAPLTFV